MKIYKLKQGILLAHENQYFRLPDEDWDAFVNDDHLLEKARARIRFEKPCENGLELLETECCAPIQGQEIWASGVTYFNSKLARQEESAAAGGGDFYAKVYMAERPELFFKGTAHRCVGPGGLVRVRRDSVWNVPEPELTLLLTSSGHLAGYTIGNDMSSRSIEGENPLYLPQAKTYMGSAALGPCLYVPEVPLPSDTEIRLEIFREQALIFEGTTSLAQIKRTMSELAAWLFRENEFPKGCYLMTGTGIVPPREFTLLPGDEVRIGVEPIGVLRNWVG